MNYFPTVKLGQSSEIVVPDHSGGSDSLISVPVKSTSTLVLDM